MRLRLAAAALAAVGLLAGCADVVDGSGALGGTAGPSGPSSTPDFPGQSGGPSASAPSLSPPGSSAPGSGSASGGPPPTPCPHVTFAGAKLSFDCITTGFVSETDNAVWPLTEVKTVEAGTGWVLEEGAGHWGPAQGRTLGDIAKSVRTQMVDEGGYGDNPTIDTVSDADTTVDGAQAHLLHTKFSLNPAWAKTRKTAVKQEQLWIVAIKVGSDDVSLWYTSIPDLVSELWAKVPSIIKTIKVG
ncbi:MAG: hypothetical protein QOC66_22 [Pseudonocardiales bacterium]|nr:hypothetical protein [Pseudonocardiales bacterium]